MIDVVTFKWGDTYTAGDINHLFHAVHKHYKGEFRFTAVTDDPAKINKLIRVIPLWDDFADVQNPQPHKPSCYRRLKLFSPEAKELIGERIVCLDLDAIVTGDLAPLWDRPEDVVFYRGQWGTSRQPYNGSMFMLTAGSRPQVWNEFQPRSSPMMAFASGYRGSDQGWYGYVLGDKEAVWNESHGVYCWRTQFKNNWNKTLPENARIVFFNGKVKPWNVTSLRWVQENYGLHRPRA